MIAVTIYTDGSCSPNPGYGGWGAILICGELYKEISGFEPVTTNNRMELAAAIEALKALNKPCRIELHTDSQYLKNGITIWMPSWKARGWKRKNGDPVVNVDLWQMLDSYICKHQITWHWVRGHNGDYYNERVDTMARLAMWEGRIK